MLLRNKINNLKMQDNEKITGQSQKASKHGGYFCIHIHIYACMCARVTGGQLLLRATDKQKWEATCTISWIIITNKNMEIMSHPN